MFVPGPGGNVFLCVQTWSILVVVNYGSPLVVRRTVRICFVRGEGGRGGSLLGKEGEVCLSVKLFHIPLGQRQRNCSGPVSGWSAKGE